MPQSYQQELCERLVEDKDCYRLDCKESQLLLKVEVSPNGKVLKNRAPQGKQHSSGFPMPSVARRTVQETVSGRKLKKALGVHHGDTRWAKTQVERGQFIEDKDFTVFTEFSENLQGEGGGLLPLVLAKKRIGLAGLVA